MTDIGEKHLNPKCWPPTGILQRTLTLFLHLDTLETLPEMKRFILAHVGLISCLDQGESKAVGSSEEHDSHSLETPFLKGPACSMGASAHPGWQSCC